VPTPQVTQTALPMPLLYVPARQGEHVPPSCPVNPALQVHAATAELVAGELLFAGHTAHVAAIVAARVPENFPAKQPVHVALPLTSLYVPAAQGEQTPPFRPVYPALQVHAVTAELGLSELEFTGHTKQVVGTVAPTVLEYVPVKQFVHAALPMTSLYVPALQAEQTPPLGPLYPALQLQEATAVLKPGEFEFAGHA